MNVTKLYGHHDIINIEQIRIDLTFSFFHRFRNTLLNTSNSFLKSQLQVSLSRSFETFQNLEIS